MGRLISRVVAVVLLLIGAVIFYLVPQPWTKAVGSITFLLGIIAGLIGNTLNLLRYTRETDVDLPALRIIDVNSLLVRAFTGMFFASMASLFLVGILRYKGTELGLILTTILVVGGSSILAIFSVICFNFVKWYIGYTKAGGFSTGP